MVRLFAVSQTDDAAERRIFLYTDDIIVSRILQAKPSLVPNPGAFVALEERRPGYYDQQIQYIQASDGIRQRRHPLVFTETDAYTTQTQIDTVHLSSAGGRVRFSMLTAVKWRFYNPAAEMAGPWAWNITATDLVSGADLSLSEQLPSMYQVRGMAGAANGRIAVVVEATSRLFLRWYEQAGLVPVLPLADLQVIGARTVSVVSLMGGQYIGIHYQTRTDGVYLQIYNPVNLEQKTVISLPFAGEVQSFQDGILLQKTPKNSHTTIITWIGLDGKVRGTQHLRKGHYVVFGWDVLVRVDNTSSYLDAWVYAQNC